MNNLNITETTPFQRNENDFLFTEVDDEMVLMNIHTSAYLGLNSSSRHIWQLLETKTKFSTILQTLLDTYEVERAQCEEEVKGVLQQMVRTKILQV